MTLTAIAVEHAGQFMFPAELAKSRADYSEGRISAAELKKIEDDSIAALVEQQRKAGLSAITDGELRRRSWDLDFLTGLNGVDSTCVTSGNLWEDTELGTVTPAIEGEISFNPEHPIFEQFVFLKNLLKSGETARVTLPAPAHLLVWIMLNSNGNSIQVIASQLAEAYRLTIKQLYELGCRSIILRDTSWNTFCDHDKLKRLLQGGLDPVSIMPMLTKVNDDALADMPADMERILSIKANCTERFGKASHLHPLIVNAIFNHANVSAFMAESATACNLLGDHEIAFPEGKGLILGVVDVKQPQLESPQNITDKIDSVLAKVTPAWLRISPTDGFMINDDAYDTSSFMPEDQWRKIALLQSVANN